MRSSEKWSGAEQPFVQLPSFRPYFKHMRRNVKRKHSAYRSSNPNQNMDERGETSAAVKEFVPIFTNCAERLREDSKPTSPYAQRVGAELRQGLGTSAPGDREVTSPPPGQERAPELRPGPA